MNNLHRHNLEVLVNLEKNQELKLVTVGEVQNKLIPDDSYLSMVGWRTGESVEKLMQVYSTSFYHFLNLIQLPNPCLMSSCINLSQLNHTEFQLGIILLLETSLKGLFRYENYCRTYSTDRADYISQVVAKLSNDLVSYKSSVLNLNNSIENEKRLFMEETIHPKETPAPDHVVIEMPEDDPADDFENDEEPLEIKPKVSVPKPEPEAGIIARVTRTVTKVITNIRNWCRQQLGRFLGLFNH